LSRTNLGTKVLLSQKPGIFDSNFKLSDVKESSRTLSELQDYLDKISISKTLNNFFHVIFVMKTNFKKTDTGDYKKYDEYDEIKNNSSELTQEEFEEFIVKSGAKGSFMVYRTDKKEQELGIDEL
jgi:hypothetical protein